MIGMFLANYTHEEKTEECTVRKVILETEECCNHCGHVMYKGDVAYILSSEEETVYMLDEVCFQTHCKQLNSA